MTRFTTCAASLLAMSLAACAAPTLEGVGLEQAEPQRRMVTLRFADTGGEKGVLRLLMSEDLGPVAVRPAEGALAEDPDLQHQVWVVRARSSDDLVERRWSVWIPKDFEGDPVFPVSDGQRIVRSPYVLLQEAGGGSATAMDANQARAWLDDAAPSGAATLEAGAPRDDE